MTDAREALREALQAIRDTHVDADSIHDGWNEHSCDNCGRPMPCLSRLHADRGLVALEAAEAAQAERDEKIHEHAEAIRSTWLLEDLSTSLSIAKTGDNVMAILGLLAAKTTTEPEKP